MSERNGIVIITGTGTSQGVPVISCDCPVCLSADPRDNRLRSSIFIKGTTGNFMIDVGPDFRMQCLRYNVKSLKGILITHEHMDHVNGLDDVRPFNYLQNMVMPIYAEARVISEIKKRYSYIFEPIQYTGLPLIDLIETLPGKQIEVADIPVLPLRVMHGRLPILGFRFGDFVYITDAKYISNETIDQIKGAKTLIINALHHREHHSHFNLQEALQFISDNGFTNVYLTHISHQMGLYSEISKSLPAGVMLAYDGLEIEFAYRVIG